MGSGGGVFEGGDGRLVGDSGENFAAVGWFGGAARKGGGGGGGGGLERVGVVGGDDLGGGEGCEIFHLV